MKHTIAVFELDVPSCALEYGVTCSAELGVTGEYKCFNSPGSCQVPLEFEPETKTIRWVSNSEKYVASQINAIPSLLSADISPQILKPGESLGKRERCNIALKDHPHNDYDFDPYIDERDYSPVTNIMSVVAYDSMLKADSVWMPDQTLEFPMTMQEAATIIAGEMGISLDTRCSFNSSYEVDYPANDYTRRDVLCFIAAAHGGNWIITDADQLLLIPLVGSMPETTHYLVTESGNPIVFGNTRILV